MRWKTKKKLGPKVGDRRIVTKFMWFPTTFDDETRWLERTLVEQVFRKWQHCIPEGGPVTVVGWRTIKWAEW